MNTNELTRPLATTVAILTLALSPGTSMAAGSAVIVQDTFTRTGPLLGSTADSGQTWTGTSSFSTTGSAYQVDGSSSSFATISGLTFDINSCYILSVQVNIFFPFSDGWMGLGFSSPTSTDPFTDTVGTFLRYDEPEIRTYVTDGLDEQIDTVPDVFPNTMTIIITTGATLAASTIDWQLDGTYYRTGEPVDMTGIDGIFLAHDIVDAQQRAEFDNLRLLAPVPEPSVTVLLGLLGLGSVLRRQR